ncbi:3-hydroxyacyl-CoA dehydrogenase NAD-binding domain-containing protein [Streptomyces sp. LHD-70]|uniref:3-hydroxyacyl-CoA dehydrogenase NAD-binding domain-containing protein n=1 Tax=Streptomyces sp. LHD-70 TaxID=3072140 RepID=UPI00280D01FC|nr:3-hydroxyacyl-CoA dehydrogenase NAD-binding domain-containing protein [Streptomyces sp. LHD-70]MDQ8701117.1 3-hydroxyacyl-CoA dehydrogenase NAD-binding domain-containing protein [Streptomyces sp. LHD-70]
MPGTTETVGLSTTIHYETHGHVAVIRLANPPVNGLGDTLRTGLAAGIAAAATDDAVRAVVIVGEGKGFCGGADLRQFGTPAASVRPAVSEVFQQILALPKPVVAAIHGFALGGGYELALACSHRIAHRDATIGLPEVNVGLLPGAGGTQRLPRLIGTPAALELIQNGATVRATRAAELGMIDACVDGDVLEAALDFLDDGELAGAQPRLDDLPPVVADGADFAAARRLVRPSTRNGIAQLAAIDSVETATRLPIEEGLALERATFLRLLESPEAKALRHTFFAEKEAAKVTDIAPSVRPRNIERVAVIGAGTMGTGIAMAFANSGLAVALVEQDRAALERGMAMVKRNYEATAAKGRLAAHQVEERLALITPALDLDSVAHADLVVEAVFEDMAVKKEVFTKLDVIAKPGAVLASNTSRLDIDELARSVSRPQDVIGLHFFSPAHVMKLLEVVRGAATADDAVVTSIAMARRIDKVPVLSKVCDGFIGNRMLTPYRREADFLLEEGATPERVDQALQAFGLAMGPFAMSDLAGLDIGWAARKRLAPTRDKGLRYSRVADVLCEAGRFGQKSGAGYYRYASDSRKPIPDPAVDQVIRQCATEDGIQLHEIGDSEIIDRCVLALVNEGARILGDGIAQRASDIDVVYVDGYGFPAFRGGPMYYAQTVGLAEVLQRIQQFEAVHGASWTPAPLLERLVAQGKESFD